MILLHMFIHVYHIWTGTKYRTPNGILLGFRVSTQIRTKLGPNSGSLDASQMATHMGMIPEVSKWEYTLYPNESQWMDQSWGDHNFPILTVCICMLSPGFLTCHDFSNLNSTGFRSQLPIHAVSQGCDVFRRTRARLQMFCQSTQGTCRHKGFDQTAHGGEMWLVRLIQNPSTDVLPEIGETK